MTSSALLCNPTMPQWVIRHAANCFEPPGRIIFTPIMDSVREWSDGLAVLLLSHTNHADKSSSPE